MSNRNKKVSAKSTGNARWQQRGVMPPATKEEALERWMREITDLIVYSADNPMDYKTGVVEAFSLYRKAIGKPLREGA